MRARRALMYVPGDDMHKIEKAAALGADTLMLDIEDGVALGRKDAAAETIARALTSVNFGRSERLVRINPVRENRGERDLEIILPSLPDGIVLPKVENAADLDLVCQKAGEIEKTKGAPQGHIKILALIETPQAYMNLREICAACEQAGGIDLWRGGPGSRDRRNAHRGGNRVPLRAGSPGDGCCRFRAAGG